MVRLEALLADDDSDAIELFKDSAPSLKALLGSAHVEMKRALEGYDFVQALAVLRTAQATKTHNKEDPVHE
jgi:two-component system sensor histidine kinase/response regulator